MQYFAHAGEAHESGGEDVWHTVISEWYIGVPLFLIALFALGAATYLLTKSKPATFGVLLVALFAAGVLLYSTSPAISIISLAGGFAMALVLVVVSIGK